MSLFAPDSNLLIVLIGLGLFALVAAFLFWTRPRTEGKRSIETGDQSQITARSALGDGRSLITVRHGDFEHVLLIGPQTDLLIDSRRITVKSAEKSAQTQIPLPFPPAVSLRAAPALPPQKPQPLQPRIEPVPVPPPPPQPVVLAQEFPAPVQQPVMAPPPLPPVVQQVQSPPPAPHYYEPNLPEEPVQPPHSVAEIPHNVPVYDNVFQASVQTQSAVQSQSFNTVEQSAPDIAIPAFLQSKINPVMMEQALPPAEAMPPHWPETPEPDIALASWENTLPPLKMQAELPPQADPALDLAARQLEDALRQKLAEAHLKQPEIRINDVPNPGIPHPVATDQQNPLAAPPAPQNSPYAAPATQTSAEAAADRFEQEIRKLLGRDLRKL